MLTPILNDFINISAQIFIAMFFSVIVMRLSHLLFGINLVKEVKEKNKAAAYLSIGILVLIALVVGLFKV